MTRNTVESPERTPPGGDAGEPRGAGRTPWPARLPPLVNWPVTFALPFVVTALLVVVYPVLYGFWLGADLDLYEDLFTDETYL